MSRSVLCSVVHLVLPESAGSLVHNIVDWFLLLKSSVGGNEGRFVEGLRLVVPVPILGSNNVSVQVLLGGPGALVEKLSIVLET